MMLQTDAPRITDSTSDASFAVDERGLWRVKQDEKCATIRMGTGCRV
jgi:hypothetical protein